MKKYLINKLDRPFDKYPKYVKLFVFMQYIQNNNCEKITVTTYKKIFKNFHVLKDMINNKLGYKGILYNQYKYYLSDELLNMNAYKPNNINNINNNEAINGFINQYKDIINKDDYRRLGDVLLKLIQENPGITRFELINLFVKFNKEHHFRYSLFRKYYNFKKPKEAKTIIWQSIHKLYDNKLIKTPKGDSMHSAFIKLYPYNYDNNLMNKKSLFNQTKNIIENNPGINNQQIINKLNQNSNQIEPETTIIKKYLLIMLNKKMIKSNAFLKKNNIAAYHKFYSMYFNDDKIEKLPIELIFEYIKKNPELNRREIFKNFKKINNTTKSDYINKLIQKNLIETDIYSKSSNAHFFVNKKNKNNYISTPPIEKIIINTVKDNKNISRRDIIKKISDEYHNYYPTRLIQIVTNKLIKDKLIYLNGPLISKFATLSIKPVLSIDDKLKQIMNQLDIIDRNYIVDKIYECGDYNNYPKQVIKDHIYLILKNNK